MHTDRPMAPVSPTETIRREILPRPDRNSLDAADPLVPFVNFKILKVRSRASCGLEILSSLLATAYEVSE
jgi:hypothetical protein